MAMIIVVGWHAQCVGVQQGKIEHNARSWLYANAHRMVRGNGSHITNFSNQRKSWCPTESMYVLCTNDASELLRNTQFQEPQ